MDAYEISGDTIDSENFFFEKCTSKLAINEIHEKEWYDFPAYHSALEEERSVHLKSPTIFERLRQ